MFSCSYCSCFIFVLISYSLDTQVMLIVILIDVQYSQKAVFSFEKGSNCQNHSLSGSLHLLKTFPSVKFPIPHQPLTAIWKTPIHKTLWPLFVDGVNLPQDYTEPLWGDSLIFTRNSWYSLNQSRKNERLRWPWSHLVVLNLFINLVITKYNLKSQYVKLTQLWPLTVNCFKVTSQSYLAGLSKICFLCTYVDQMIIQ